MRSVTREYGSGYERARGRCERALWTQPQSAANFLAGRRFWWLLGPSINDMISSRVWWGPNTQRRVGLLHIQTFPSELVTLRCAVGDPSRARACDLFGRNAIIFATPAARPCSS